MTSLWVLKLLTINTKRLSPLLFIVLCYWGWNFKMWVALTTVFAPTTVFHDDRRVILWKFILERVNVTPRWSSCLLSAAKGNSQETGAGVKDSDLFRCWQLEDGGLMSQSLSSPAQFRQRLLRAWRRKTEQRDQGKGDAKHCFSWVGGVLEREDDESVQICCAYPTPSSPSLKALSLQTGIYRFIADTCGSSQLEPEACSPPQQTSPGCKMD